MKIKFPKDKLLVYYDTFIYGKIIGNENENCRGFSQTEIELFHKQIIENDIFIVLSENINSSFFKQKT